MNNTNQHQPPGISIDDALNLFLAVTYPNGIPEGVDKGQLMDTLRQKIAKDRPQWAKDGQTQNPPASQDYAKVKEQIVQRAQQEDIPGDPEERYLYERRKEAIQNRETKKEEEREHQIREDLRKRLIDHKNEEDKDTLEKALRIRKALEQRLCQSLQTQTQAPPGKEDKSKLNLGMQAPNVALTAQPISQPFTFEPQPGKEKQAARDFFNQIKDLSPEDKVRSFREFNLARRHNLKNRDELLSSRKPSPYSKRKDAFSIDDPPEDKETRESSLSMDFSKKPHRESLTLE
jgi:hypothetical protein